MSLIEQPSPPPAQAPSRNPRSSISPQHAPGLLAEYSCGSFGMPSVAARTCRPGTPNPIRIMSEDYALYRGHSGTVQIVAHRCPHRGAPMHLGCVEDDSIRCAYHGWKFERSGRCIEQPAEEPGFARKVSIRTCPTREYLELVFGYFGPANRRHSPIFLIARPRA